MEFLKKGKGCIVFGFGKLKFKNVDKTTLDDQAHIQDYENAEVIGHVRLGKLCLYYKEFGRYHCVPYSYIDRSFTRVSECQGNDFMADTYYYRLWIISTRVFSRSGRKSSMVLSRLKKNNTASKETSTLSISGWMFVVCVSCFESFLGEKMLLNLMIAFFTASA